MALLRLVVKSFSTRDLIEEFAACQCFAVQEGWTVNSWAPEERWIEGIPMPDITECFSLRREGWFFLITLIQKLSKLPLTNSSALLASLNTSNWLRSLVGLGGIGFSASSGSILPVAKPRQRLQKPKRKNSRSNSRKLLRAVWVLRAPSRRRNGEERPTALVRRSVQSFWSRPSPQSRSRRRAIPKMMWRWRIAKSPLGNFQPSPLRLRWLPSL